MTTDRSIRIFERRKITSIITISYEICAGKLVKCHKLLKQHITQIQGVKILLFCYIDNEIDVCYSQHVKQIFLFQFVIIQN